jgi:hypothetical protein
VWSYTDSDTSYRAKDAVEKLTGEKVTAKH